MEWIEKLENQSLNYAYSLFFSPPEKLPLLKLGQTL